MNTKILEIYYSFFKLYGPQGWWPLIELHLNGGVNPTKSGSIYGYHPLDYSYPQNEKQRFEIIIGAILTQNTAWPNVEKALLMLDVKNMLDPKRIIACGEELKEMIRPAGYFNQKSEYLRNISKFIIDLNGKIPSREQLLKVKGVGNETADSILLYAYQKPEFVVDTYTMRIFSDLKLINKDAKYLEVKHFFESNLMKDYKVFQEYHALIVEHYKRLKI